MATETQIVKEFVRKLRRFHKGGNRLHNDHEVKVVLSDLRRELTRDDLPGRGRMDFRMDFRFPRDRQNVIHRLHLRIMKKLRQPFRRKNRGPLRRRAAGKNEVTRK